jgi:Hint domain
LPTISFWVRGDGSTANNDALNVENQTQQPVIQITFDSGPSGDLSLEYNGGAVDPDTTVIIGGVPYPFTVELVGTLPTGDGKVPDPLEGKQIAVISVVINGNEERFFFVIDGTGTPDLMAQFQNGAIGLNGTADYDPPPFTCFCTGTMIATPSGPRAVEKLVAGDLVLNDTGEAHQIQWIGRSRVDLDTLRKNHDFAPIRIRAGAFGPSLPATDLFVSPQHRIVLEGPAVELLFGADRVLAAAKHLVGTFAEIHQPGEDVEYFHILTENHEILVSNGLPTESFQPARRRIDVMSPESRIVLERTLSALGRDDMLTRKDALPSLKGYEVSALAMMLQIPPARSPAAEALQRSP